MSDILIRQSDGRVLNFADTIVDGGDHYVVTAGGIPTNVPKVNLGAVSIVSGVALPGDVTTKVYTYAAGAFTAHGDNQTRTPMPSVIDREALLQLMEAVDGAAFTAAITDPRLSYFFSRIAAVDTYHSDAPELLMGLSLMVALGHWTQAQSDSFVSSWPTN